MVCCVAEAWPGVESIYTFSTDKDNERAMYHLERNDPTLHGIDISWPLPSASVLRQVVNALSSHFLKIERVNFVEPGVDKSESFVEWSDSETMSNELLITALRENTSIKEICVETWNMDFKKDMIDIVHHSRQLESLTFRSYKICKERLDALMKHPSLHRLFFENCEYYTVATAMFVEALKGCTI